MASLSPIAIREQSPAMGLTLPDDLGFEEWCEIGRDLAKAEQHINWWIGDWWGHGDRCEYGEAETTAKELLIECERGSNPTRGVTVSLSDLWETREGEP